MVKNKFVLHNLKKVFTFATASPAQPAPENPPGWERSKGNWL